jgi:hypothetical protein
MTESSLRQTFGDICLGFTQVTYKKSPVFIKHFSHFEQINIELEKEKYFKIAISRKIPTKKEKLDWLIKEGLWSKADDEKIRDIEGYLNGLKKSKEKAFIKSQIDEWNAQIGKTDDELFLLKNKKTKLIGLTAEQYSEQKMENAYIKYSFFKDKECEKLFFTEKEFNRLDDEDIDELFSFYMEYITNCSHQNLKKIAISDFFTSYFYLKEDCSDFFSKPIYKLSYNQLNLIKYGNYFKSIFKIAGENVPEEALNDPEKLEQWALRSKNAKESAAKHSGNKNGRTAYIGATEKDDGKFLGGMKDDTMSKGEINTAWDGIKSGKIKMN